MALAAKMSSGFTWKAWTRKPPAADPSGGVTANTWLRAIRGCSQVGYGAGAARADHRIEHGGARQARLRRIDEVGPLRRRGLRGHARSGREAETGDLRRSEPEEAVQQRVRRQQRRLAGASSPDEIEGEE